MRRNLTLSRRQLLQLSATGALAAPAAGWFNALAGKQPERVLIDSDLDWGQDLFRLERALRERRLDHVYIAYFGASATVFAKANRQVSP